MTRPLKDLLVIDLSRALAGPYAAMMLADMGARVIKVESPVGDDSRGWGPPFVGPDEQPISTYFLSANRNKESIVLDLKSEPGRATLTEMISRADVLIENFRTGVLARLGFDEERLKELNPGLVTLSITGFGHDGPEAMRPGFDQIAQGEGGLMSLTGPPGEPTRFGLPITDLLAGMFGAYGVMAQLHERSETGIGGIVRTSLLAAAVGVHSYQGTQWTVAGEVATGTGNHHPSIAPYGLFATGDTPIQVAVGNDSQWSAVCEVLDLPADERFATNASRVAHREELIHAIEDKLALRNAGEWLEELSERGVPAGKVRTLDEVYSWEQTLSQGLLVDIEHPVLGPISIPGPPIRLGDAAYAGGRASHLPPPLLGEHTEQLVREFGPPDDRDGE